MNRDPIVRKGDMGKTIAVVGDIYRFLATGEDTNGKYAMWEAIVPPESGPPPHVHRADVLLDKAQVADSRAIARKQIIKLG